MDDLNIIVLKNDYEDLILTFFRRDQKINHHLDYQVHFFSKSK